MAIVLVDQEATDACRDQHEDCDCKLPHTSDPRAFQFALVQLIKRDAEHAGDQLQLCALPPICLAAYVRGQWLLAFFGQAAFRVQRMAQRGTEAFWLAEFGLVSGFGSPSRITHITRSAFPICLKYCTSPFTGWDTAEYGEH